MKKPVEPYWLDVTVISQISMRSHKLDRWYPYILFVDENMKVVSEKKVQTVQKSFAMSVPSAAKYVRISDIYTLDNIKRGLSISGQQ